MLIREKYLSKIRDFYDITSLIKIIYGMRRSGKSVILTQIIDEIKNKGVNEENIIYINFESLKYDFIKTAKDLYNYIESLTVNNNKYYVFLDEIQKVEDFEKGINSLRITDKYSIFITGSNSRMTLLELSTDLSGRYVSFKINPLSFKEVVELTNTKKDKYEELLLDIFKWGSLPQRFLFKNDNDKINYLESVYDSIILKDIVERLNIKDVSSFNKLLQYILDTEGKEFSRDHVINFLKQEHHSIANDTLYNYLEAFTSTFIMNKVNRYDIHGKTKKGEIDFIVVKNNKIKYIQVCYKLDKEETIKREFGAFNCIDDDNEKYIISLDKKDYSKDGIKHLNIFDFLMNDEF